MSNGLNLVYACGYFRLISQHQPCWNAPSGPNLDLLWAQQSDASPFYEYYAKLYFDATNLEKGLNRVC